MVWYIVAIVVVAFIFDFINGFHDSANSIATVVGTRVLSPLAAVIWAATFNFLAAFLVGTAVAKAIGSGMINPEIVTPNVILGGLLGAIIWNLITWFYGLPSSSSHALIGGYAGAIVGFLLLVAASTVIWLQSRKAPIDHHNVNAEWAGNLTAGTSEKASAPKTPVDAI